MFGISLFEAFGFGFLVNILGQFKYIIGGAIAYLEESTFYKYLQNLFNVNENKSIRSTYNKPEQVDWKAEFEKAEREREIQKWKEKYAEYKKEKEGIDKKTIALTLIFLIGTAATFWYGKEALDLLSPLYNLSELIRKIMRGNIDDDDDSDSSNGSIKLDPTNKDDSTIRAISPDMLVYSSDSVEKKIIDSLPENHPAKISESERKPSFLDALKEKPKLKKTEQAPRKFAQIVGKVLESTENLDIMNEATSSKETLDDIIHTSSVNQNLSLKDKLAEKFDKMNRPGGDDITDDPEWKTPEAKTSKKDKFLKSIKNISSSLISLKNRTNNSIWKAYKHL